jgi:phage-related protein
VHDHLPLPLLGIPLLHPKQSSQTASIAMSSIVKALSDLVSSLVELVWSFFTTAAHLVENTASFAAKSATEILELVINFFKGLVDLAGGIVSFLLGRSWIVRPCSRKII